MYSKVDKAKKSQAGMRKKASKAIQSKSATVDSNALVEAWQLLVEMHPYVGPRAYLPVYNRRRTWSPPGMFI